MASWRGQTVFDIETSHIPDVADYLGELTPPKNYKKEEAIAEWREKAEARERDKAALDVDLLRIVALSMWEPEGKIRTATAKDEHEERLLLRAFWRAVSTAKGVMQMIGFNIRQYDLPALLRRSFYLGVDAPPITIDKWRSTDTVADIMDSLSMNGILQPRSKDFYCRRLGITVDDPVTGADVPTLIAAGDYDTVAKHCIADVKKEAWLAYKVGLLTAPPIFQE